MAEYYHLSCMLQLTGTLAVLAHITRLQGTLTVWLCGTLAISAPMTHLYVTRICETRVQFLPGYNHTVIGC